jgi:hypothetical protein
MSRSLADVVRGKWPHVALSHVDPPVLFVSAEGEYGSVTRVRGLVDGVVTQRDVGALVGDGWSDVIIGITTNPTWFDRTSAHVYALLKHRAMWLGDRRRQVLYPPPPGWHGIARGLDAHWYPPAFPRDAARLVVFAALPCPNVDSETAASELEHAARATDPALADWSRGARQTAHGLLFQIRSGRMAQRQAHIAVAADARYVYAARLETTNDAHVRILEQVLDGLQVVPTRGIPVTGALSHWAD